MLSLVGILVLRLQLAWAFNYMKRRRRVVASPASYMKKKMACSKGSKTKGQLLLLAILLLSALCASLLHEKVDCHLRPWNLQSSHLSRNLNLDAGGNNVENIDSSKFLLLRRLVRGKARKQLKKKGICCVSDPVSNICITSGAVRIATATSSSPTTVYLAGGQRLPPATNPLVLLPYTRKSDSVAMERTSPVQLLGGHPDPPPCDAAHPVPAIVFSTGGFAGNFFHDINDVIIPLFITASRLRPNVRLVVTDFQPWWVRKFRRVLSKLSSFDLIVAGSSPSSPANVDAKVHCFPAAVVGLKFHGNMACNSTEAPGGVSILDFCRFLRGSLSLMWEQVAATDDAPLLVLLSRRESRTILNEEAVADVARKTGFRVVVAGPSRTSHLGKFAELVNQCSVLMGVHGAGLANMVFLPPGAVVIQIVPWGLDWASAAYFGRPAKQMGLHYVEYHVAVEESTLQERYPRDHPVLADPWSVHRRGYNVSRPIYTEGQDVRLDVVRLRETLLQALQLLPRRPPPSLQHRRRN